MEKDSIDILQANAINKINFVYNDLKIHPQVKMTFDVPGENMAEKFNYYLSMLTCDEKEDFRKDLREYLRYDAITESKMMLIINYLFALLANGKNNQISIYNNSRLNQANIKQFAQNNSDIINKIKTVRDKVYAHMDLDWLNYVKAIEYEEIERCINFLNDLFGLNSEDF